MKKWMVLLALVVFIGQISFGQLNEKDLKKHQEKIEKSLKGKAVVSFDTLFYDGKSVCLFIEEEKMMGSM